MFEDTVLANVQFLGSKQEQCMGKWIAAFSLFIGFIIVQDYQDQH